MKTVTEIVADMRKAANDNRSDGMCNGTLSLVWFEMCIGKLEEAILREGAEQAVQKIVSGEALPRNVVSIEEDTSKVDFLVALTALTQKEIVDVTRLMNRMAKEQSQTSIEMNERSFESRAMTTNINLDDLKDFQKMCHTAIYHWPEYPEVIGNFSRIIDEYVDELGRATVLSIVKN